MNTTSKRNFIIKRTINEFLLIVLVILALFTMSTHFKPLTISTTLSPDGQGQGGWPLPFSSSYDKYDNTGFSSYKTQQFDVGAFEENILIFYVFVRIIMAIVEGVIYRYNLQQYKELVLRVVKRIVAMMVFLFLVYGVYMLRESIINTPREITPVFLK